jgi:hypothetical protein
MEMSILQVGSVPPFLCIVQIDLITFFPQVPSLSSALVNSPISTQK